MKLHTKIMMISLLPVFILGIGIFILAADRIADGIYDEAYDGMQATSLAIKNIFEVGNQGSYHVDENGDLWKGETLNISKSTQIVDHIKETTGMDVTIFWGDTRILTSIKNSAGDPQIGTKASDNVIQTVLKKGNDYFDRNTKILDDKYIVCYTPFYQNGADSGEAVGMVFIGKPRYTVSKIINQIRLQMLIAVALVLLVTGIIVIVLVNHIVHALEKSMHLLQRISEGDLTIEIDPKLLKRRDEVGMLGKEIQELRNKLQTIINVLSEKSIQIDLGADTLKTRSENILQAMKGLDQASHEMSASCMSQAEDAANAGNDVTIMGEMLGSSHTEIKNMYQISNQIQSVSEEMMTEILELNQDMKQVRQSIHYLGEQTNLTKESADKIGHATELIAAVASQTSLLALNASIEAARAGDSGKGFGVVATEIQNLSVQANNAVKDIWNMVESLTQNSDHTIQRMEEVHTVIKNQENTIQKTGMAFENVRNQIQEFVSHVDTLLEKAEKIEQIRTDMIFAVQNSAALSQENAARIEEMMASVQSVYGEIQALSGQTNELGTLSTQMKGSVRLFVTV